VFVSTVVGFPHGSSATATKVFEAERALDDGARELDMVLNIGRLRSGLADEVRDDIAAVVEIAADRGGIVKVIFENAFLDDAQKVLACRLSEEAGATFVKTSTGFAPSGATIDDLRLMRRSVGPDVQVKAAGGVRTLDALLEVMAIGVTRVGATATETILEDFKARKAAVEPAAVG
jgi:deoxyribose-phosphate aldolase